MQQQQKISFIDVRLHGNVDSKGIATRDNGESYEDFFRNVFANENVIGLEWDGKDINIILG